MLSLASSSSTAMGMGGYPHQQQPRGAAVFTGAQCAELEQQALIYKYLMVSVPMPPDLLLPICPHSAFSFGPAASSFYHHPSHLNGSRVISDGLCRVNVLIYGLCPAMSYYAYYRKKLDPEMWRCRRTDGKKWRCSKEAHPNPSTVSTTCAVAATVQESLWNPTLLSLRTHRSPSYPPQPVRQRLFSPSRLGLKHMACLSARRSFTSMLRHMAPSMVFISHSFSVPTINIECSLD